MIDFFLKILDRMFNKIIQARMVRVTMHKACFCHTEPPVWAYFITITNLSKQDIVVTHVGMDCRGKYIAAEPQERTLPKRIKPVDPWQTWIEFEKLPKWIHDNPYPHGRVWLSTGRVIKTKKAKNIPAKGEVPGGPVRPEYSGH